MKELQDGTILLYRAGKGLIGKAITYFTGMPYAHVAGYVAGFTLESTIWWSGFWWKSGIRIALGAKQADEYWQPVKELNLEQIMSMQRYFISNINKRRPYNIAKFLVLALVYPTRRFWQKIGWIPFSADYHGDVCSVVWDEAYRAAGIDLFPHRSEEYTAPGDFRKSKLLKQVGGG